MPQFFSEEFSASEDMVVEIIREEDLCQDASQPSQPIEPVSIK